VITAVDSNILLDIFTDAPGYADASARALRAQLAAGSVVACAVVWAEVAMFFPKPEQLRATMKTAGIDFSPDSEAVALAAAAPWQRYRKAGGRRERLIADFLIGAHALVRCDCLLSRDRGFYRDYFKGLHMIAPARL
jgi:predicted nucleic acid-binding protein